MAGNRMVATFQVVMSQILAIEMVVQRMLRLFVRRPEIFGENRDLATVEPLFSLDVDV